MEDNLMLWSSLHQLTIKIHMLEKAFLILDTECLNKRQLLCSKKKMKIWLTCSIACVAQTILSITILLIANKLHFSLSTLMMMLFSPAATLLPTSGHSKELIAKHHLSLKKPLATKLVAQKREFKSAMEHKSWTATT